jgi:hypothetical protein
MWALVDKVGTWYKMEGNYFLHVLHRMKTILFLHKKHIEIVQLLHVLYAKNVQEIYLEKIAQILLPRNTCGAMLSTHFSHCFNAFFMWKQNECFYQCNLCKKTRPSILPSSGMILDYICLVRTRVIKIKNRILPKSQLIETHRHLNYKI